MKEILFAIIILTGQVTGQAPGDETSSCLTQTQNAIPRNIRVLMDSYNYAQLLGVGGVWTTADPDGSGTTWTAGSGGNCQRTTYVCERSPASNWVFTQYIFKSVNTQANMTIFINITTRYSSCTAPCGKWTSVYYTLIANNSQTPPSNAAISSSSPVGNITGTLSTSFDATLGFNLKPNEAGFYLALRDAGNCPTVNRVKVYYYQCPSQQVGRVLFPQIPAPTRSNSPLTVIISCVDGGVNTTSLDVQCDNNGVWSRIPLCDCRLANGYYPNSDGTQCIGCGPGYWLNIISVTCQLCPQNSSSASLATSECPCIAGYYRTLLEGPGTGCTAPPSGPNNLTVFATTNTSITLSWGKPDFTGRDDYYFVVKYRNGSSLQFITTSNVTSSSDTITYTISSLNPYTSYEISVIARNGVSNQDISNEYKRTALINSMTLEGVPSVITNIIAINQYVIWQPPTEKNGIITGYVMKVCRGELCKVLALGPSQFVYEVQVSDIPSGTSIANVQVRAKTMVGSGNWSSMVTLTNNTNCPSSVQQQSIGIRPSSPSTCPSAPSCSMCPMCPSYTPLACPSVSCPQQSCSKLLPVTATPCPSIIPCHTSPSISSSIYPKASSCPACPSCTTSLCLPCNSCTPAPTPALASCKPVSSCSACPSIISLPPSPSPSLSCPQMISCQSCPQCPTSTPIPCAVASRCPQVSPSTVCPLCPSQSCPPCSRFNSSVSPLISSDCVMKQDSLPLNSSAISAPNLSFPVTIGISVGLTCFFTSAITVIIVSLACMVYNMKQKRPISGMKCEQQEMDVKM